MNEKETNSIMIIEDKQGKKIECEILFLFKPKQGEKRYVVYTDNTTDESGAKRVYGHIYYDNNNKELFPIETEEEWYTIEAILDKLEEKSKEV